MRGISSLPGASTGRCEHYFARPYERGLSRVRDKFANQQGFGSISGDGVGDSCESSEDGSYNEFSEDRDQPGGGVT